MGRGRDVGAYSLPLVTDTRELFTVLQFAVGIIAMDLYGILVFVYLVVSVRP